MRNSAPITQEIARLSKLLTEATSQAPSETGFIASPELFQLGNVAARAQAARSAWLHRYHQQRAAQRIRALERRIRHLQRIVSPRRAPRKKAAVPVIRGAAVPRRPLRGGPQVGPPREEFAPLQFGVISPAEVLPRPQFNQEIAWTNVAYTNAAADPAIVWEDVEREEPEIR